MQRLMITGSTLGRSLIRELGVNLLHGGEMRQKKLHQFRIKLIASTLADIGNRIGKRPGPLVATLTDQGIKHIGQGDNATSQVDCLPF